MCGRFAIVPHQRAWAPVDEVLGPGILAALRDLKARYNVAPTQGVPIIYQDRDTREVRVEMARWGFVPSWWKQERPPTSTINARSEEARSKPMWRHAWAKARCLIPATHWYEWRQESSGKRPHALTVDQGDGFMFAGLYSFWRAPDGETLLTAAILTRDASPAVAHVHDRMPLILSPRLWEEWLEPAVTDARQIDQLLGLNDDFEVETFEISTRVNKPANTGPDILDPI